MTIESTIEQVIESYKNLGHPDEVIRDQANKFLMNIADHEEAWQLA
jgi:hypothetical protein